MFALEETIHLVSYCEYILGNFESKHSIFLLPRHVYKST